jgi:hypothetical protein
MAIVPTADPSINGDCPPHCITVAKGIRHAAAAKPTLLVAVNALATDSRAGSDSAGAAVVTTRLGAW